MSPASSGSGSTDMSSSLPALPPNDVARWHLPNIDLDLAYSASVRPTGPQRSIRPRAPAAARGPSHGYLRVHPNRRLQE
eukprot:SAG22_NODE_686_length_7917_cov_3.094270_2_plen_79_part_00